MLMTINNIYDKCAHNNVKIIYPSLTSYGIEKYDNIKNFNNSGKSGEKAAIQLEIIYKCLKNFIDLKREFNNSVKERANGIDHTKRDREKAYFK